MWKEDNTPVTNKKACPKCNEYPLQNGIDPCLGELSGVRGACCGHGVHKGYIWFENGKRIILNKNAIKHEMD